MKIALIGGVFDSNGGRSSGYVRHLADTFPAKLALYSNGGNVSVLDKLIENLGSVDAALWFADVPNDQPKLVTSIKARWPKLLLVTSKRNLDGAYPMSEILGRALKSKSNLVVEVTGERTQVESTILDPLGSAYCLRETNITKVADILFARLQHLAKFRRVASEKVGERIEPPDEEEFYRIVRDQAERFHAIIHGVGHERMMGNASFRCAKGFPSVRQGDLIFVSRRDVDKRHIGPEAFVAVELGSSNPIRYHGDDKPSVDTPIQVRLYQHYPRVRYMLHSHTYIEGAPMTPEPIPCGAVEEAEAVIALVADGTDFAVNLRGHGSIVFASTLTTLHNQPWAPRPIPELA
jgi:hypothetical protein